MILEKVRSDKSESHVFYNNGSEYNISSQPLSSEEIYMIIRKIKGEPCITGYDIKEWSGEKEIIVIRTLSGELSGVCLIDAFCEEWSEIAVVYVLPMYRGNGVAKTLINEAFTCIKRDGKKAVIYFQSMSMARIIDSLGFEIYEDGSIFTYQNPHYYYIFEVLYKFKWLNNAFRRSEIIRKKRDFDLNLDFSIGVSN